MSSLGMRTAETVKTAHDNTMTAVATRCFILLSRSSASSRIRRAPVLRLGLPQHRAQHGILEHLQLRLLGHHLIVAPDPPPRERMADLFVHALAVVLLRRRRRRPPPASRGLSSASTDDAADMFYEFGLRVETHYIARAVGVQVTKIVRYAVNYLKCLAFGLATEKKIPQR